MLKKYLKKIYYKSKLIYYYGNKYRCPCCNHNFRKFEDFNYKTDLYNPKIYTNSYNNTICPYCLSLPRHRIICEYLDKNKNIFTKDNKTLVFASEICTEIYLNRNSIEYNTADLYEKADLKIDITKINLKDESYDVILCNHVLEHVTNYKKALKELNRILTKNGFLILSVPIDRNNKNIFEKKCSSDKERKKVYGQADHLRNFGTDMKKIIENYSFEVEEVNGDNYDSKIVPIIGPGKYDYNHIFVCRKK